ncbi:MAG: hypothetical protein HQL34_05600 [Alphaproteobacteria bacterium]|nr:hypothetical protein [Alphaproteobacteria bacterium]
MAGGKKGAAMAVAALLAVGEAGAGDKTGDTAPHRPAGDATQSGTVFSDALTCLDRLLAKRAKAPVAISGTGVVDYTQGVLNDSKDMLLTALSRMTQRSRAFIWHDFDGTSADFNMLRDSSDAQRKTIQPSAAYYIRSAVTGYDKNVSQTSLLATLAADRTTYMVRASGKVAKFEVVEVLSNVDVKYNILSLDMNLFDAATRSNIPGATVTNSIVIESKVKDEGGGGEFGKVGLQLTLSTGKTEGLHATLRALVEVSLLELLGQHAGVPYWTCLGMDSTSPMTRAYIQKQFETLDDAGRVVAVVDGLVAAGYLASAQMSGKGLTDEARAALTRYQSEHGLTPNGRIDFDTFLLLQTREGGPTSPSP